MASSPDAIRMSGAHPFPPPDPGFRDPRTIVPFQPELYPLCNGGCAPPPDTSDPFEFACLEFLAAHYRLNAAVARQPADPSCLPLVEATNALHELLDRYAPIGFFGDPVRIGPFCRDLRFQRPGLFAAQSRPESSAVAHLADQLPRHTLHGKPVIRRWQNGKVDP